MSESTWRKVPSIEWITSRDPHLGEADKIDKWWTSIRVFIGEAPICLACDDAAKRLGLDLAPWTSLLTAQKRSWLLRNVVSLKLAGGIEPDAVGLELVFRDDQRSLNTGKRVHVHSLFPSPEFRVLASTEGSVSAQAEGAANCEAVLTPGGAMVAPKMEFGPGEGDLLYADGRLHARAEGGLSIALSMTVCTTKIAAIGSGDTRAQWEFHKDSLPLVNRDIETWTGLLLPSDATTLTYEARASVVFGMWPFPIRRETEWITLTVELPPIAA